ncbi:MAG: NAD(P)H-quinone oxidoreductase [Variovorax paradoxus]|uniref:NAD(P)H-quinone oxidoreductase n=1 Tax=Variovorax paradoxus TaxID=34073 RepID=A0A2W5QME0_VARPD|nr:MAG: NAD(P)H-quinone oxidoreductase [Variovorax paradoxus]
MRYVAYGTGGGPDVLRTAHCERPMPREGEVLLEVAYAGVNRPDCAQRIGRYPPPPSASPILGLEVAGRVAALGPGVARWRVGDFVCALVPGGGYAEFCAVPATHCLPVPAGLSLAQAAALPETCFTVWDNVFVRARLQASERFLVHGGAGGIGTTAIQMASALGARVMATAGDAAKADYCRGAGAERIVLYREEDFVAAAMDFTEGHGLDVVLDMVAGPYLERDLEALAMDGRIAVIAFMGGAEAAIDVVKVLRKRASIMGSTLRPRSVAYKADLAAALEQHWWPRLAEVRLQPVVHSVFDLDDAARAHALMESGMHSGKIVLAVRPAEGGASGS